MMPRVLAIDPGPRHSAYVIIDQDLDILTFGFCDNEDVECVVGTPTYTEMAIESVRSYGQMVGNSTFDTSYWEGKLCGIAQCNKRPFYRYGRKNILTQMFGSSTYRSDSGAIKSYKDSDVRAGVISRYKPVGAGKTPQVGTKKNPGPLYGMSSHMWSALAVAHHHLERKYKCVFQ